MYFCNNMPAAITPVVEDFLTVEIKQPALQMMLLEYRIFTTDDKLVRKGTFTGNGIRLRLSPLSSGQYVFYLYANGHAIQHRNFEVIHEPALIA